jgi:sugar O-acyltransferase (sialic acid O-acetyltransferase NeuD family)
MNIPKEKIVLIGGGGHCKSCIDVIEMENKFEIHGIIDLENLKGKKIYDYEILGSDHELDKISKECNSFLITVGFVKDISLRLRKFAEIEVLGGNFATIISPRAYLAKSAKFSDGTIVMHNVFINREANIGKNCILNTGCLIEHDCFIDDHTHLSPGCLINGGVSLGKRVLVGSGAVIRQGVRICDDVIIGAGAVVVRDLKEPGIYFGNPARKSN